MSAAHRRACFVVASIALAALLWPIAILGFRHPGLSLAARHTNAITFIFLWALGPAIWFVVEWRLWGDDVNLVRGQQYARDFWLGAGAIVLLFAAQELTPAPPAMMGSSVISWTLVVDVIRAAVWPLVAIVGLILFRKPLASCLSAIGMRASKIGAFNISLELATLPDARPWSGPDLDDLKAENPASMGDSSGSLFRAIADTANADYVTVDLMDGEAWLTSRLFILTALISRVRRIQRIVFLSGPAEEFLGECSPLAVTEALAHAYPWLEEAYICAHVQISGTNIQLRPSYSVLGRIAPIEASSVLNTFLYSVKQFGGARTPGWTDFGNYREHGEWVSASSLVKLLGRILNETYLRRDPSEDGTVAARTLLRHDEDYVAVVDMSGRFLRLVDRHKATDEALRRELAPIS